MGPAAYRIWGATWMHKTAALLNLHVGVEDFGADYPDCIAGRKEPIGLQQIFKPKWMAIRVVIQNDEIFSLGAQSSMIHIFCET